MNKRRYILTATAFALIALAGCSRKKDKFLNRNIHAMNTKYNILYNGNLALEAGVEQLSATYQDNYWDILPVERMQEKDVVMLPGTQKNDNFERAEEKASKAIQKHSMNIGGREKNSQIDEAFILLGKSRYYEERMIPALEAFNYVLKKYPESSQIVQAKIWREKVNMRLDNNELALLNLKKMFKYNTVEEQDNADARAMMAEAYLNLKYYDSAATSLGMAATLTKKNEEKGRYYYILGQLYTKLGKNDKANWAYNQVIDLNRRSPRIYMIHAQLEKIKSLGEQYKSKYQVLEILENMAKNRENRPYLDIIYHELGNFYMHDNNISTAAVYYNLSLRERSRDKYLNALNYSQLGEMQFNERAYKNAGKYYDSTLLNLNENTKMYRAISKKKDNLEDVIYYEDMAQRNDSILALVHMSDTDREVYFDKIIAQVKAERKAAKEEEERQKLLAAQAASDIGKLSNSGGSSFYFYNDDILNYGRKEFSRIWGDRELTDDWRFSSSKALKDTDDTTETKEEITQDDLTSLAYYLATIPSEEKIIDSIAANRNEAYYQLGLIYFAKFKEYDLAAERLETLLEGTLDENLVVPAKYNLYKVYLKFDEAKAIALKSEIIQMYPNSRYAKLLMNPQATLDEDENSPDAVLTFYNEAFDHQEYELILDHIDNSIAQFTGDAVVPKLEMMKASAIARLDGIVAYKDALSFISLNYPTSEEGRQAKTLLQGSLKKLQNKKFNTGSTKGQVWKIVVPVTVNNQAVVQTFETTFNQYKKEEVAEVLPIQTSVDVYNRTTQFYVLHSFQDTKAIAEFLTYIQDELGLQLPENRFFITSENYTILQTQKNIEEYNQPTIP